MRKTLFIPGPSEVEDDVLSELLMPVIPHYGREWAEFYESTCDLARKIFDTKGYVTILPIPGIVSVEMAIFNVVENQGDKVVCLNNGFFSNLIERILRLHGADVISVKSEWGSPANIDGLERALEQNPEVKAVFMVHNETSTGVLNNVAAAAKITRKFDKLFCVDAVSSFGGAKFDFDGWGVDYAVGYASKCLSGINGVTPVAISDRFIDYARKRNTPVKSYYFNLPVYQEMSKYFTDHPHPTSMPTSVIRAFHQVAKMAVDEGLENRYERHVKIAKGYRAAIIAMGLQVLPREEYASPTVTAISVNETLAQIIPSLLSEHYGIIIGGGLGILKGKVLRIGHMGTTADRRHLIQFVSALEMTLKDAGLLKKQGNGLAAAYEQLK